MTKNDPGADPFHCTAKRNRKTGTWRHPADFKRRLRKLAKKTRTGRKNHHNPRRIKNGWHC